MQHPLPLHCSTSPQSPSSVALRILRRTLPHVVQAYASASAQRDPPFASEISQARPGLCPRTMHAMPFASVISTTDWILPSTSIPRSSLTTQITISSSASPQSPRKDEGSLTQDQPRAHPRQPAGATSVAAVKENTTPKPHHLHRRWQGEHCVQAHASAVRWSTSSLP
jgi:hypothetical protein